MELLTLTLLAMGVFGQCSNPRPRREWRQLSQGERNSYISAVRALKDRPFSGNERSDPATWNHDQFAKIHWDYQAENHNRPPFFPWHRRFLQGYENALRSIDSSVSLPYWDWTLDSQNPSASDVLSVNAFGLGGEPGTNCMQTGAARGWTVPVGPNAGRCLRRCPGRLPVFQSPETVSGLVSQAADYETLRHNIEDGQHALTHASIGGGACGDFGTMTSAGDPLFYLHHAMVDKLWWRWQQSCADFATMYVRNMNTMEPFRIRPDNVFSTTENGMCYSYSESRGDLPLSVRCPSGSSSTASGTQTVTVTSSTSTTSASATPTNPAQNPKFWLQHWIQGLLPNTTEQARGVDLEAALMNNMAALMNNMVKRSVPLPINPLSNGPESAAVIYPNGYGEQATATSGTTAMMEATSTGYPTVDVETTPSPLPTPVYVFNPNYTIVAPASSNLTDLVHLRHPGCIDEEWAKMMKLDMYHVKRVEVLAKQITDEYNNKKGYISPAALKNYDKNNHLGLWTPKKEKCKHRKH